MPNPSSSPRPVSHIGAGLTIKGEVFSEEDLEIDGCVEGGLEAAGGRVIIGRNATVRANVKGADVTVLGKLRGNVEAQRRVAIGAQGELVGDIRAASITIEDEAYYKGNIDLVRPGSQGAHAEPKKPQAAENVA